jgi:PAS domain S-box-containing protein
MHESNGETSPIPADAAKEIKRLNELLEQRVRERTAELEASEARLALLVETVPAAIVIHGPDGRILRTNPTARRLLGLTEDEASGKPLNDRAWQFLREDGSVMDMSEFPVTQVLKHRSAFWNRIVGITENGEPKLWAFVNALPQLGPEGEVSEVIVGFMDITERIAAETALRQSNETLELKIAERTAALLESEKRFRLLAEAALDGIAITEDGIFVDANPQLASMMGRELADMLGRPIWDFMPDHAKETITIRLREDSMSVYDSHVLHKDGTEIPVEITGRTMLRNGKTQRVTILRDLRAARQAAEQIEGLRTSLERSRRVAEISEISAAVVHQLGQPFAAMAANVGALLHLLRQGPVSRECAEETLTAIEADLRNVREIMSHVRALIHPEKAKREAVGLNQAVSEVLRIVRLEAEHQKTTISFDPSPEVPRISADRVQISQLILNLVRNALESVADRPAGLRNVEVTVVMENRAMLALTVRDSGHGIANDIMPRIFDAFFTTKPDGMGVGLRISRTIAEAHGGSLRCGNRTDGPGAFFTALLPIAG